MKWGGYRSLLLIGFAIALTATFLNSQTLHGIDLAGKRGNYNISKIYELENEVLKLNAFKANHTGDNEMIQKLHLLTNELRRENQDVQEESRKRDDKLKDLQQQLESKILELKASAESHLDDSGSGLRGNEHEHDHNDEDITNILPTPGFPGFECEQINWFGEEDSAVACYDRVLADDNCGKRFMTYNALNKGCACYPIDMAGCTLKPAQGRTSWDFEPFASSVDGALIDTTETLSKVSLPPSLFEPHEICSFFPSPTFTASNMWLKYLPEIFNASNNPDLPELTTPKSVSFMRNLLNNVLTPSRMRRAIQHLPTGSFSHSHSSVKHVMDIIQKRIQDPENNPPLRVAVFGGSVTLGSGCAPGVSNPIQFECSWARRFELLVNQFASIVMKRNDDEDKGINNIIEVYNHGIGGSKSNVGAKVVKYWIYSNVLKVVGPDVIIHSYSTNDSFPPWVMEDDPGADAYSIMSNKVRLLAQNFIRDALQSRPCSSHPPLVIDVDDYVGPQQKGVLGELSYNTVVTQLAKWYDIASISYAELVRDIVYKDTLDQTFSNIRDKNVHYGMWGHQTIAWSVGFGALELDSNYCDDEYRQREERRTRVMLGEEKEDKEYHHKVFLPPRLTAELLTENVTNEFYMAYNASHDIATVDDTECNAIKTVDPKSGAVVFDPNPCPISWISWPRVYGWKSIIEFMHKFQSTMNNWNIEKTLAEGYSNKVGWVANGPNATFSLSFKDLEKSISKVTIFYLISYGERWEGSRVRVTISTGGTGKKRFEEEKVDDISILSVEEISGFHHVEASITQLQEFVLSDSVPKGDLINIKFDMIGGNTFKIMGLCLCQV